MIEYDQRTTLVRNADVLVIGGGAAGLATAVTSSRQGLRVILVERYGFCGGGAVAGMSGTICGMYEASDNRDARPVQVVHGFLDTFVTAMEQKGGLGPPLRYGKTFTRVHDPFVWREVADDLLAAAGVEVIYHAMATGVLAEGGEKIEGARLFTKQGPMEVRAKVVVDASGDADLVAMAGLPNFIGNDGRVQNPTMIFRLLGVDVDRFVSEYGMDTIMPAEVSERIRKANSGNSCKLPRAKIWLFPTTRPGELLCNCTRVTGADGRELNTLIADDFTEAEIEGRRQAGEYARFFREYLVGCEKSFINDSGVQVGVRQTRQALGRTVLRNHDVLNGTKFRDGIARSPWPIELHSGAVPKVEWLLNDFYEIPFACFVPERGSGLLFAGRCLSAEHEAVASARVTAQCFSYGHAVGHAAALSVKEGVPPGEIEGNYLRDVLNRDGAGLDS